MPCYDPPAYSYRLGCIDSKPWTSQAIISPPYLPQITLPPTDEECANRILDLMQEYEDLINKTVCKHCNKANDLGEEDNLRFIYLKKLLSPFIGMTPLQEE